MVSSKSLQAGRPALVFNAVFFHRNIVIFLIIALGFAAGAVRGCEPSPSDVLNENEIAWAISVRSDMSNLPSDCDTVFSEIVRRLGAQSEAKAWIESVVDVGDASSINLATISRITELTERALLGHGIVRWRVRMNGFGLPRQDRHDTLEIGRIRIYISKKRPAAPQ
jgi:hypothetical protein